MMTGEGPFGAIGMGGMFSVVKVRKDQKANDYRDPGWFKQPAGTSAFEYTGAMPEPHRFKSEQLNRGPVTGLYNTPEQAGTQPSIEVKVKKPTGHKHGH
jgi:manganese oxidase